MQSMCLQHCDDADGGLYKIFVVAELPQFLELKIRVLVVRVRPWAPVLLSDLKLLQG